MNFKSCFQCGGQCCTSFGVPIDFITCIREPGVPISIYESKLDRHPERYLSLHDGVKINRDMKSFTIDRRIKITVEGNLLIVHSRCNALDKKGRCMVYETRPDICRNFTAETAEYYIVPEGCKYETGKGKQS